MANYYVKNSEDGTYANVATTFSGVRILAINGMTAIGEAINVYNEQWVDGTEDFLIAAQDGKIARKNIDVELVFICANHYVTEQETQDLQLLCDTFTNYMTQTDVWIRSEYTGKDIHAYCNSGMDVNTIRLKRGHDSYIVGKIKMHTLAPPTNIPTTT